MEGKHFFSTAGIALKSHTDETGKSFLSYKDALAANGHVNADIHYLKLDVETTEYEVSFKYIYIIIYLKIPHVFD